MLTTPDVAYYSASTPQANYEHDGTTVRSERPTVTSTLEAISTSNKSALKLLTSVQKGILDAQKEAAATFANIETPSVPDWVPTLDGPTARELVEESLTFPAKVLESNKAFALGLLDIWSPAAKPVVATKKPAAA